MKLNFNQEHLFETDNSVDPETKKGPNSIEYLQQIEKEIKRLEALGLPLETEMNYSDFRNGILPHPVTTALGIVKKSLIYLYKYNQTREHLYAQLSARVMLNNSNSQVLIAITELREYEDFFAMRLHDLSTAIGSHNQKVIQSTYYESGKKSADAGGQSSDQFMNKHWAAFEIMKTILHKFYSEDSNRNYKPNIVIDAIQTLCEENNIAFPEDRKGVNFNKIKSSVLYSIFKGKTIKGQSKQSYRMIDYMEFKRNYNEYCQKVIPPPPLMGD